MQYLKFTVLIGLHKDHIFVVCRKFLVVKNTDLASTFESKYSYISEIFLQICTSFSVGLHETFARGQIKNSMSFA